MDKFPWVLHHGDRIQVIVNGHATTFTMHHNPSTFLKAGMSLTQALSDGINSYLMVLIESPK